MKTKTLAEWISLIPDEETRFDIIHQITKHHKEYFIGRGITHPLNELLEAVFEFKFNSFLDAITSNLDADKFPRDQARSYIDLAFAVDNYINETKIDQFADDVLAKITTEIENNNLF